VSLRWFDNVAAYFFQSPLILQVEYNCAMIKMIGWRLVLHKEWLVLYCSFSYAVGVQFAQSSSQWEAMVDYMKKLSLTLLTNEKYTPRT
jgi:hypothetical protein